MGTQKLLTAGGGGVQLTPASSIASDVTVQIPSQNCTLGIQGPAFSAYTNTGQALSLNVWTKLVFQVEEFDTNNCYDNTTNHRFTPTVAGYYQVNALFGIAATATNLQLAIYKNGSIFKYGTQPSTAGNTNVVALIYCNGSTDYLEIYANLNTNAQNTTSGQPYQYFQASMVRGA